MPPAPRWRAPRPRSSCRGPDPEPHHHGPRRRPAPRQPQQRHRLPAGGGSQSEDGRAQSRMDRGARAAGGPHLEPPRRPRQSDRGRPVRRDAADDDRRGRSDLLHLRRIGGRLPALAAPRERPADDRFARGRHRRRGAPVGRAGVEAPRPDRLRRQHAERALGHDPRPRRVPQRRPVPDAGHLRAAARLRRRGRRPAGARQRDRLRPGQQDRPDGGAGEQDRAQAGGSGPDHPSPEDKVVIGGFANPMVRPGATVTPQPGEIKPNGSN